MNFEWILVLNSWPATVALTFLCPVRKGLIFGANKEEIQQFLHKGARSKSAAVKFRLQKQLFSNVHYDLKLHQRETAAAFSQTQL